MWPSAWLLPVPAHLSLPTRPKVPSPLLLPKRADPNAQTYLPAALVMYFKSLPTLEPAHGSNFVTTLPVTLAFGTAASRCANCLNPRDRERAKEDPEDKDEAGDEDVATRQNKFTRRRAGSKTYIFTPFVATGKTTDDGKREEFEPIEPR
ncbi:hypothetical protein CcaCcLH18_11317 [Colletotrichum camelliae]|nr:hypothetical protein CcaCcLH18_11317 [Colletotrichum camelliae]